MSVEKYQNKNRTLPGKFSKKKNSISSCNSFNNLSNLNNDVEKIDKIGSEKVKHKLIKMWNNVKYGWNIKIKTNFNLEEPIWLLGICYLSSELEKKLIYHYKVNLNSKSCNKSINLLNNSKITFSKDDLVETDFNLKNNYSSSKQNENSDEIIKLPTISSKIHSEVIDQFKHDFFSRIWVTYRREFKKIQGSHFTSDCGWGCMLRSGQMMLAQAFLCHYLKRSWRWTGAKSDKEDMIHRMLIKWFGDDDSSVQSPFSVHQLVKSGISLGKKPGDWYGPSSVAYILQKALEEANNETNFVLDSICIYVAQDCTIYLNDLINLCTKRDQPFRYKSLSALKKEKTNLSNHQTINFLNGHPLSNSRKKIRNSLKSLNSCTDLIKETNKLNSKDQNYSDKCSSGDSSTTSDINSLNQSNDDVFTSSSNGEEMKSYSLNIGECFNLMENLNKKSINSSSSSNSSQSTKSNCSSTKSSILKDLKRSAKKNNWKSVVILIPLRLGGEKFNSIYTDCIKKLFQSPYCIGIIGGKPKHSLYFVGCQDDKLIYLDPHFCQETVDINRTNFNLNSYHCSTPRKLTINRMDPSCTIGFYCKSEKDLNNLIEFTRKEMIPSTKNKNSLNYPIFIFDENSSINSYDNFYENLIEQKNLKKNINNNLIDKNSDKNLGKENLINLKNQYDKIESEDFVMI